jgi:hypothetical protein
MSRAAREAGPDRRQYLQLLLLVAPAALLAVMAWQHRWVGDDAFIDFRIVRQLKAGHGPVFNAGEWVEAGTSPLWLMILFAADVVAPLRLEWIAVVLGIGFSVTGVILAQRGAWLIVQAARPGALVVPFGALLVAALPPMWDFSTSGLETGLSFAWLGVCFWGIARRYHRSVLSPSADRMRPPLWLCVLIGLGPLVRPDFAVYSVVFIAAAFVIDPGRRWPERAYALGVMLALPVASEPFSHGVLRDSGTEYRAHEGKRARELGAGVALCVELRRAVLALVAVAHRGRCGRPRDGAKRTRTRRAPACRRRSSSCGRATACRICRESRWRLHARAAPAAGDLRRDPSDSCPRVPSLVPARDLDNRGGRGLCALASCAVPHLQDHRRAAVLAARHGGSAPGHGRRLPGNPRI